MAIVLRQSEVKAPRVLEMLELKTGYENMGVFTVTYSLASAGVRSDLMLVAPLSDRDLEALRGILARGGDFAAGPYLRFALLTWPGADPGTKVAVLGLRVDWQSSLEPDKVVHTSFCAAVLPGIVETADGGAVNALEAVRSRDHLPVVFCHRGKLLEVTVEDEAVPFQLPVALLTEHLDALAFVADNAPAAGLSQEDGVIESLAEGLRPGPHFNQALFQALF